MFNKILLFVFCSFIFSEKIIFQIKNTNIYDYDFYETVPYSEWVVLDTSKQRLSKNSFLEKELVFFESLEKKINLHGEIYTKLNQRESQLLINFAYENFVAYPLIKESDLVDAKQHIKDRRFVYHLLLGYDGCSMPGVFPKNKEEVLKDISVLQKKISDSLSLAKTKDRASVFQDFVLLESEDPSASQNKGALGWISWGRTVSSFQKTVFDLPDGALSEPVLTDFGYHLVFVEKTEPSDFSYYNPFMLENITKKTCLQTLDFEKLRSSAIEFDSTLVSSDKLKINKPVLKKIFKTIEEKTKDKKLRGNKNSYINWIEEKSFSDVLFIYNQKAYGVGWFVYYLNKMPATRVPSIKTEGDLLSLLKSFILQKAVLLKAEKEALYSLYSYQKEFLKHKKNILQKEYSSFLLNSIEKPDSLEVFNLYNKGVYKGDYIKPKSVVYSEIKTSSEDKINKAYNHFLSEKNFDNTLKLFDGTIKSPVSEGSGGPLSLTAFGMKVGEVSSPIENRNKTFSLIRVEKFIEPEPFSLAKVYNQIERKIIKEKQDSIKFNLLKNLKNKYNIKGFDL
tara:strand:- start:11638 stop:13329 length:1692 start_codon:yes stop_codon:yes gene_type:complete